MAGLTTQKTRKGRPLMRPSWQKYLHTNVPRYTSYPSALEFNADVGPAAYARALARVGAAEPLSLYVHVPFCKQLCWYCGCNMRVENKKERIAAFVDVLLAELRLVAGELGGRGRLSQIHFGGGTPNTLTTHDIDRILVAARQSFGADRDIPVAMEIDPRLCGDGQATRLAEAGVSRFSIGVQDFDPKVQEAINRVQPFSMVERVVGELRTAGIRDISLDLLYGLPRQTLCTFARTVEDALRLRPERISLFGYAHIPQKLRHQRLIDEAVLPARGLRPVLAETAARRLEEAGYERIGFDHFALPGTPIASAAETGRLNRNFQGYTEDQAETVVGLGPSAISTVHGTIAQNAKGLTAYRDMVSCGDLPVERGLVATLEEEDLGHWLRRLLCNMRASLPDYFEITGADGEACDATIGRLEPLLTDRLARIEGDEIVIEEEAKPLARVVAAAFDPYVQNARRFASPAV